MSKQKAGEALTEIRQYSFELCEILKKILDEDKDNYLRAFELVESINTKATRLAMELLKEVDNGRNKI